MAGKDWWQALIPGWNIIYFVREWRRMAREDREREAHDREAAKERERAQAQVNKIMEEAGRARAAGESERASVLENEAGRLVLKHIDPYLY